MGHKARVRQRAVRGHERADSLTACAISGWGSEGVSSRFGLSNFIHWVHTCSDNERASHTPLTQYGEHSLRSLTHCFYVSFLNFPP
jgi:hypothetical protein